MDWHEIVKYSPKNYDNNGAYKIDEWTSRSDIGKCYNGKVFTLDDYLKIEQQYIDAVLSIMSATESKYLTINYLEINKDDIIEHIKSSKFYDIDSPLLQSLSLLKENNRISYEQMSCVIRLCLREFAYLELSNNEHKLKIEFGYDYYLRVLCSLDNTVLQSIVDKAGLYLDPR